MTFDLSTAKKIIEHYDYLIEQEMSPDIHIHYLVMLLPTKTSLPAS